MTFNPSHLSILDMFALGWDDDRISSYLSSVTFNDIPVADLENLLSEEGLARRNPVTGSWEGELISVMETGGELGEALEELFSHLNKPRSVFIESSKEPWASKAGFLVSGLVAAGHISAIQEEKVYALSGGKLYVDGYPLSSVAEARLAYEAEQSDIPRKQALDELYSRILNEYISPAKFGSQSVEQVIESIKQGL